jgi:hypothetical protein
MPLYFQTPGLLAADTTAPTTGTLTVRALLFYEGTHLSMSGETDSFDRAALESIVEATNGYLAGGRRIKLYASDSDHSKISQDATIGFVTGSLTVAEITAADLPLPGLTDLVGKQGIFGMLQLSGQDNIDRYKDGRLKELSIGIDAQGSLFGIKNLIYEISAVSIPSLAGAAIFSATATVTPVQAIAQFRASLAYALTLTEQIQGNAIQQAEMRLWRVWDAFAEVLADIRRSDSEGTLPAGSTAESLRSAAIEDLITQIRAQLQIPTPQLPIPLFAMSTTNPTPEPEADAPRQYSTADIAKLVSDNEALKARLDQSERTATVASRFSALKEKAIALRDQGKLKPAQFGELFDSSPEAIQRYSAPGSTDLDKIEFALEQAEKYATPIQFGLPIDTPALDGDPDQAAAEAADKFLDSHPLPRSY